MKDNKVLLEACDVNGVYLVERFDTWTYEDEEGCEKVAHVFVCDDFEEFLWRLEGGGSEHHCVLGYACTLEEAKKVQAVYDVAAHPGGKQANLEELAK